MAGLSWILSFRVHVKNSAIVSYRTVQECTECAVHCAVRIVKRTWKTIDRILSLWRALSPPPTVTYRNWKKRSRSWFDSIIVCIQIVMLKTSVIMHTPTSVSVYPKSKYQISCLFSFSVYRVPTQDYLWLGVLDWLWVLAFVLVFSRPYYSNRAIGTLLRPSVVCLSVRNVLWLNGAS